MSVLLKFLLCVKPVIRFCRVEFNANEQKPVFRVYLHWIRCHNSKSPFTLAICAAILATIFAAISSVISSACKLLVIQIAAES